MPSAVFLLDVRALRRARHLLRIVRLGLESRLGMGDQARQEVDEPVPPPALVYALGRVDVRVPSLGIENELAQVVADPSYDGLTERNALRRALTAEQNRYL